MAEEIKPAKKNGIVTQVMGPVVDVRFEEESELPTIYNALTMPIGDHTLTVEVESSSYSGAGR